MAERATALLSEPGGGIHPRLQPVYDTLIAGPRPQTTLYWFTRSTGPAILAAMARGELEISHTTFETLPVTKTTNYLRDLLSAVGVLPAFNARLERLARWVDDDLTTGLSTEHADLLTRFARWHVLRKLRTHEQRGTLTNGAISAARATLTATRRFLRWLQRKDTTVTALTQHDIDRYAVHHRGRAVALRPFLTWAHQAALTGSLESPAPLTAQPEVTLSDADRWAHIELLLHDDTIRLYARIAGLFVLLYAQQLARVCRMRADQVTIAADGTVSVTFDTFPIELPDPLDELLRVHLARRGQASYASRPDRWLFPGGHPGRHLATENIRSELVRNGIQPKAARNAAMFGLAATMPTPILAEILGLAPNTATRWAALASRDWSHYTAQRSSSTVVAQSMT